MKLSLIIIFFSFSQRNFAEGKEKKTIKIVFYDVVQEVGTEKEG